VTEGNETRLLVITPETENLFSYNGDFEIAEIIVANSYAEVSVELPSVGNEFKQNDAMAIIDSVKASSDIYCPLDGKIVAVNEELLQSPELINKSPFESGWIVKLEPSNTSQLENLMAEEEYKKFVGED